MSWSMTAPTTTLERAFQIASLGRCRDMTELRHQLHREGFHDHQRALFGVSMRAQLQALMGKKKRAPAGRDAEAAI